MSTRKTIRLGDYDYSQNGAYFITICTQDRKPILSEICNGAEENDLHRTADRTVGEGLAPPKVKLLPCGEIANLQILDLPKRFPFCAVDAYVIMPNHIHLLLRIDRPVNPLQTGGASPSPTAHEKDLRVAEPVAVTDIIRVFKSLTTRECKKNLPMDKLFQRSFYDHIIRNEQDYLETLQYIEDNPAKWAEDELNSI